jgi:hypothetical protein
LNTQLQTSGIASGSKLSSVQNLYNSYAAMLLGYIFEVVKSRSVAEQYLVAVFNDVQDQVEEFYKPGVNAFCRLQLMARKKLAGYFETVDDCSTEQAMQKNQFIGHNKFIKQMSADQQLVFCGAHWHGKSIAKLAVELGKPEGDIRKILKECFTIIRTTK